MSACHPAARSPPPPARPARAQVPTRTLVQIRTHAQKYFIKNRIASGVGTRGDGGGGLADEGDAGAEFTTASGITMRAVATLRHVCLEPLHPMVG